MPFCWHPQGVYCAPKKLLGSFPSVLSTTLSPSLRSCSRLLFPRGTRVTCKEKSLPSRHIAAKTPDPKISGPAPTPVQKPALSSERQHSAQKVGLNVAIAAATGAYRLSSENVLLPRLLAPSISDQVAGEVSLLVRFRQRRLDTPRIRGPFQPKYEEKHLFLGWRADRF